MKTLEIWTAQLPTEAELIEYADYQAYCSDKGVPYEPARWDTDDALDVTVKSGDPTFAPTWHMVMGYKNRQISQHVYRKMYLWLMRKSLKENRLRWCEVAKSRSVTFLCYCPPAQFCHRLLLVEYMRSFCASIGIDAIYMGERR